MTPIIVGSAREEISLTAVMNEILQHGQEFGIDWDTISKDPSQLPRDFVIKVLHQCIQHGIMTTQLYTENGETDGKVLRAMQALKDGGNAISEVGVFKEAQEKISKFVTDYKNKEEILAKAESALMGMPAPPRPGRRPFSSNERTQMEKQKVFISRDYVTFDQMKRVLSRIAKQR